MPPFAMCHCPFVLSDHAPPNAELSLTVDAGMHFFCDLFDAANNPRLLVVVGGPILTVDRTIFEMWLWTCT